MQDGVYKGCGENLVSFLAFSHVLRFASDQGQDVGGRVHRVCAYLGFTAVHTGRGGMARRLFFIFHLTQTERSRTLPPIRNAPTRDAPLLDHGTTERRRGQPDHRDPAPRISSTRKTPTAVPPRHRRLVLGLSPIAGHGPARTNSTLHHASTHHPWWRWLSFTVAEFSWPAVRAFKAYACKGSRRPPS